MDVRLQSKTKGSRLRLSVRGLLILVLATGVYFYWIVRAARLQETAVWAVETAGGNAFYDEDFLPLSQTQSEPRGWREYVRTYLGRDFVCDVVHVELWANGQKQDIGGQVSALSNFRQLGSLNFIGVGTTDEVLKTLPELRSVWSVTFQNCSISDAGMVHLGMLPNLTQLQIGYVGIDDAGLARLPQAASLTDLALVNTKVTDAGLCTVRQMSALNRLTLAGSFSDEGLANLRGSKNLQALFLRETAITDNGLAYLRDIARLDTLDLSGTSTTGAGLSHLRAIPNLRTLYLSLTQISAPEVAELRRALPITVMPR
jgi:hypothetical protein